MNKDRWLPVISGIIVSVLFGLSFMFTREALDILAPMQLLSFRFALAALCLTVLRLVGVIRVDLRGKNLNSLFVVALFQPVLYFSFETTGVKLTSASEAGMIMGLIPVVVVLLEVPFFKSAPSIKQLASVVLSVAGVFFIVVMKGNVELGYNIWGTLALIGAVLAAGMYNIYSKKSTLAFTPVEITYLMMWTGALLFNGIVLIQHIAGGTLGSMFLPLAQPRILAAIVYLGIFSSVLAFFLMNFMLSKIRASQTATYINLTTVVAILGGILFRGETFAWFQGVGAFMIILGVWGTAWFGREEPLPISVMVKSH